MKIDSIRHGRKTTEHGRAGSRTHCGRIFLAFGEKNLGFERRCCVSTPLPRPRGAFSRVVRFGFRVSGVYAQRRCVSPHGARNKNRHSSDCARNHATFEHVSELPCNGSRVSEKHAVKCGTGLPSRTLFVFVLFGRQRMRPRPIRSRGDFLETT